jgi:hypothetical protein
MANKIAQLFEKKGIPIIKDQEFYPKSNKGPYIAVGYFDAERFQKLYNKIQNGIFVRNKRLFSVVNGLLRKFYRSRKVTGSVKLKIIQSPDNSFNIRIVNGGYKTSRPYVIKNKLLTGNKKGLKDLQEKLSIYKNEYSKFASFIQGGHSSSSKRTGGPVQKCAELIAKKAGFDISAVHYFYEDDQDSYPLLELTAIPTEAETQAITTISTTYHNKNLKVFNKVQKLLKNQTEVIAGLPIAIENSESYRKLYKFAGTFAVYSTDAILFPDKSIIAEAEKAFSSVASDLK